MTYPFQARFPFLKGSLRASPGTALLVTSNSAFFSAFVGSALTVALPALGKEFSLNASQLGWVITTYILPMAILLLPMGRLADLAGRKRLFFLGNLIFTVTSVLSVLARGPVLFFFSRFLQGVGASMISSNSAAILSAVTPPTKRGQALGINTAMVYLGLSVGPFVGGILISLWGWRLIYLVTIGFGILNTLLIPRLLPQENLKKGHPFDLTGAALYSLVLFLFIPGTAKLPFSTGFLLLLGSLSLVPLFLFQQRRSPFPLIDKSLLRGNSLFLLTNLTTFIHYASIWASSFLLTLYLQNVRSLSPQTTGLILLTQPVIMFLLSPITGSLSDRMEPRILASSGMVLTTLSLASMAFLTPSTPLSLVVGSLLLLGFGYGLFSSPNTNAIMGSVEKKDFGFAAASLGTMRLTGQSLSMSLAMVVLALIVGNRPLTQEASPQLVQAMRVVFCIQAPLAALGIFTSLSRGAVRKKDTLLPGPLSPEQETRRLTFLPSPQESLCRAYPKSLSRRGRPQHNSDLAGKKRRALRQPQKDSSRHPNSPVLGV